MMRALCLLLTTLSLVACQPSPVQVSTSCRITEFGVLAPVDPARQSYAPDTPTKEMARIEQGSVVFSEHTRRVPAEPGLRFGFRYQLTGIAAGEPLEFHVRHPAMTLPDGRVVEGFVQRDRAADSYGYGFDHPWELVAGPWLFQVRQGERLLCEQGFETFLPASTTP